MTEDDLLEAIAESPNDDGPRLVYADWLQQQADERRRARGEYIALACTTVRPKPAARTEELLEKYGASWLGPLVGVTRRHVWARGFVDSCELRGYAASIDITPALEHPEWRALRAIYTDTNTPDPTFEQIAELLCQRAIKNLKAARTSLQVLRLLAESAHAPRLVELQFHPWGGEGIEQLLPVLDAEFLSRLRKLHLLRCPRALLQRVIRPQLGVLAVAGPPRSLGEYLAELVALQAPLEELRLVSTFAGVFEQREMELVLHGKAGTWSHLEVRWSYDDHRTWREEVLATLPSLAGAIQRLSFVGPPSARFDVTRFKHRVAAALPGATVD